MKKHFYALRILSIFFTVIGWIIGGISLIMGLILLINPDFLVYDGVYYSNLLPEGGRLTGALVLIMGLILGLGIVALGEYMKIAMEVVKNTRTTNELLEMLVHLSANVESAPPPVPGYDSMENGIGDNPGSQN
jgi:hypothetical protein